MKAYQMVFTYNNFDWRMDDYILETTYGIIYTTREEAEKHKAWFYSEPRGGKCEVLEIEIYEKCNKTIKKL